MAAGALGISKLSEEEIDVADAATARQHGVEAVRRDAMHVAERDTSN